MMNVVGAAHADVVAAVLDVELEVHVSVVVKPVLRIPDQVVTVDLAIMIGIYGR